VWLFFWLRFYTIPEKSSRLQREELSYIQQDQQEGSANEKRIPWVRLLGLRQTWTFIVGKFFTDPVWWFFLFWLPSYFSTTFSLDLTKPSLQLGLIYLSTAMGSIGGGYLSGWLIRSGWPVFKARKLTMLVAAVCVMPVFFAKYVTDQWTAVAIISLAAAAHNAWSANIFTVASDMFPKKTLSSVIGIGGMAGSLGGILFPLLVGYLLDKYKADGNLVGGYNLLFIFCSLAYIIAWLLIHALTPRMQPADVSARDHS
jgi:MFS transporter, ACS family, hexuronate transporter